MELVAQAYSAAEMDLPIILSSADLIKNLEEKYGKRLREFNILDPKNVEKESRLDCLPKSKSRKHFSIYSENESVQLFR